MKENIIIGVSFICAIVLIFLFIKFAYARQDQMAENQQKLNFLCSPGVYITTVSSNNIDYAICKMTPTSEELIGKKISK